jgi:plastocyanin
MKKVLFFAGSLFVLVACSKDQSIEGKQDDAIATVKSGSSSEPGQNIIHILSTGFTPDSLLANINSTVSWVNDDNGIHTVTSDKFDSGDIPPGAMFKYAFDNTGRYPYSCRYHPHSGVVVIAGIR